MMSGCMALSVTAVSISVSPLRIDEDDTDMFMTSAPSRLPASSKEACVRVEASKKRLISVRPRSDVSFFSIWRLSSTNSLGEIEQADDLARAKAPRSPANAGWLRTNDDLGAMFIKAVSIGASVGSGKSAADFSSTSHRSLAGSVNRDARVFPGYAIGSSCRPRRGAEMRLECRANVRELSRSHKLLCSAAEPASEATGRHGEERGHSIRHVAASLFNFDHLPFRSYGGLDMNIFAKSAVALAALGIATAGAVDASQARGRHIGAAIGAGLVAGAVLGAAAANANSGYRTWLLRTWLCVWTGIRAGALRL